MYDMVLKEGRLFSHDWHDFAIHDEKARFEIGDVTAELVERKWHEAYRRFYLRPAASGARPPILASGRTSRPWPATSAASSWGGANVRLAVDQGAVQ